MKATDLYNAVVSGRVRVEDLEPSEFLDPLTPNAATPTALVRAFDKYPEFFDLPADEFADRLAQQPGVGPGTVGNILAVFAFLAWLTRLRDSARVESGAADDIPTEDVEGNDHAD